MQDALNRAKPKSAGGGPSDMGVVGLHFNPGPDSEERLRRLFIILLEPAGGGEEESQ